MPNTGRRRDDDPDQTVRLPGLARALAAIESAPKITGPKKADRVKVAAAVAKVIRTR